MKRYRVILRTEQAMLATELPQAGNLVRSLPYVPGSSVWGALASRYAAERDGRLAGADRDRFDELFYSGAARFGNLYPAYAQLDAGSVEIHPALPVPRSAFTCRAMGGFLNDKVPGGLMVSEGHGVTDALASGPARSCGRCASPLEAHYGFYAVVNPDPRRLDELSPSYLQTVQPLTRQLMHNEINDALGITARAQLFGYESLEYFQFFSGYIDMDDHVAGSGGWPLSEWFTLYVGKARSKQGEVRLIIEEEDALYDLWRRPLQTRLDRVSNGEFSLTLVSDAVVVDEFLLHHSSLAPLLPGWADECGATRLDVVASYVGVRRFTGWNGIDARPREEEMAIAKGSCFRIKAVGAEERRLRDLLARLEAEGIGLRRNEGFGALLVNDSFHQMVREAR